MADIDTNVTALRPKTRDATAAERQRRFRKKRKARLRSPVTAVTRNGVPPSAGAGIDVAAYTAAIVLAGAAACGGETAQDGDVARASAGENSYMAPDRASYCGAAAIDDGRRGTSLPNCNG